MPPHNPSLGIDLPKLLQGNPQLLSRIKSPHPEQIFLRCERVGLVRSPHVIHPCSSDLPIMGLGTMTITLHIRSKELMFLHNT